MGALEARHGDGMSLLDAGRTLTQVQVLAGHAQVWV